MPELFIDLFIIWLYSSRVQDNNNNNNADDFWLFDTVHFAFVLLSNQLEALSLLTLTCVSLQIRHWSLVDQYLKAGYL